jgi:hypothetical protein
MAEHSGVPRWLRALVTERLGLKLASLVMAVLLWLIVRVGTAP